MAIKRKHKSHQSTLAAPMLRAGDIAKLNQAIGNRLRELRRAQGFTLRGLAAQCGLSANGINLIELGKISPCISTLQLIAIALKVPVTVFFKEISNSESIIYTIHDQRLKKELPNYQVEELGSIQIHSSIEVYNPHHDRIFQQDAMKGNMFIYCLSGQVIYNIAGREFKLEPGDSLLLPLTFLHSWHNPFDDPCKVIVVKKMVDE